MNTLSLIDCSWRAAALRGLARIDGRDEALVSFGAGQFLRIPLSPSHLAALRACVGQRVWVDADRRRLRTAAAAEAGGE